MSRIHDIKIAGVVGRHAVWHALLRRGPVGAAPAGSLDGDDLAGCRNLPDSAPWANDVKVSLPIHGHSGRLPGLTGSHDRRDDAISSNLANAVIPHVRNVEISRGIDR